MRNVLIVGGQFGNQGAHLMLKAAADAVRTRMDAAPVVDITLGTASDRAKVGVGAIWTPRLRKFTLPATPRPAKRHLQRFSPVVLPSDVDAVLDISGFRYGDAWQALPLERYAGYLFYWSSRGVPVYMLPQAFGPFNRTAAPSTKAMMACRIVIPRDPSSAEYVQELDLPASTRVDVFGDFTMDVEGEVPPGLERLSGRVPIVANYNIIERSKGPEDGAQYVSTLVSLALELKRLGVEPYGLLHGGGRDRTILDAVAREIGGMEIVAGVDGVGQKGLIGMAPLVVSGRFHAAVSGLSQGVPTIIHGWSHKYQWLADDYGMAQFLIAPMGDVSANVAVARAVLTEEYDRDRATGRRDELKAKNDQMWQMVVQDWRSLGSAGLRGPALVGIGRS